MHDGGSYRGTLQEDVVTKEPLDAALPKIPSDVRQQGRSRATAAEWFPVPDLPHRKGGGRGEHEVLPTPMASEGGLCDRKRAWPSRVSTFGNGAVPATVRTARVMGEAAAG